jgi:hypothetical protein
MLLVFVASIVEAVLLLVLIAPVWAWTFNALNCTAGTYYSHNACVPCPSAIFAGAVSCSTTMSEYAACRTSLSGCLVS